MIPFIERIPRIPGNPSIPVFLIIPIPGIDRLAERLNWNLGISGILGMNGVTRMTKGQIYKSRISMNN